MATAALDLTEPLARYAARLHAVIGARHHIVSPVGAWWLLALAGPAVTGEERAQLAEALGCDIDAAAQTAADLLGHPHPMVPAAAAVWIKQAYLAAAAPWLDRLPAAVQSGAVPTAAGRDAWAREHSLGLIDAFPVAQADPDLIMATAIATRVSWQRPFDVAPAGKLGAGPWSGRLKTVLRAAPGPGHQAFIATTTRAGDVAVHLASAQGGLLVVSVCAAADVAAQEVITAGYGLAARLAQGAPATRRSLFDLPLGETDRWSLTEAPGQITGPDAREERYSVLLPAWSAHTEQDLGSPSLGFGAAAAGLARLLGSGGERFEARQAAIARYGRIGFEAAAVTMTAVAASARLPRQGVIRSARLRFAHPYAVIAVIDGRAAPTQPWSGVPVFSGWVADPHDVED